MTASEMIIPFQEPKSAALEQWDMGVPDNDEDDPGTNRKLKRRLERLPGIRFARDKHGLWVKGIALAQ